jgi:hypothetical protein
MKILLKPETTIAEVLIQYATRVGNSDISYNYLPFWFEFKDGELFMHHLNNIPLELKDLILELREEEPVYIHTKDCKDFANAIQPLDERELNF